MLFGCRAHTFYIMLVLAASRNFSVIVNASLCIRYPSTSLFCRRRTVWPDVGILQPRPVNSSYAAGTRIFFISIFIWFAENINTHGSLGATLGKI